MEIILHFDADFDCVYLINGAFLESAAAVRYRDDEVMYVTALPLSAMLLPYTVKLTGPTPATNAELAVSYHLTSNHYYIRLLQRYNYVYSPVRGSEPAARTGVAARFFEAVKKNDLAAARSYMTEALSQSIDDHDLAAFFDDAADLVANDRYVAAPEETYFLIDRAGNGALFRFELSNNLIDNIVEVE